MAPLDLVSHEQQPGIGRELARRDVPGKAQRQVCPAGADRFRQRLLGEVDLVRLASREGREQLRRTGMVAIHRRRARLDVGSRQIVRGQSSRGLDRCERDRRESGAGKELTCLGNWGLRRLLE
jgi:hypothetical protein